MALDPKKNDSFKIDGSIHPQPQSSYIEERTEYGRRKPRILIALLSLAILLSFVWTSFTQYQLIKQRKQVAQSAAIQKRLIEANSDLKELRFQNDSLIRLVLKLQTENELLSENYEPPKGIFFEVQLGSFNNFDLNAYLQNLAALRQEKHDRKTKLLLGRFRSFKKAMMFESDLKQMGINKVFIVGRIDHKIVSFQEALNALEQSNN